MPLLVGGAMNRQQSAFHKGTGLIGSDQQMHIGGPVREQMEDIALTAAHHGDHVRLRETVCRHLGTLKPEMRFLVVRGAFFVRLHAPGGCRLRCTDPALSIDQAHDVSVRGAEREDGVEEQTRMLTIAAHAETALVGFLGRKQDVGRVRDGQKMPPFGTAVGPPAGGDQHFVRTDGRVGEEVVELEGLIPVVGQSVYAKRSLSVYSGPRSAGRPQGPPGVCRRTVQVPPCPCLIPRFPNQSEHRFRKRGDSQIIPELYDNGKTCSGDPKRHGTAPGPRDEPVDDGVGQESTLRAMKGWRRCHGPGVRAVEITPPPAPHSTTAPPLPHAPSRYRPDTSTKPQASHPRPPPSARSCSNMSAPEPSRSSPRRREA